MLPSPASPRVEGPLQQGRAGRDLRAGKEKTGERSGRAWSRVMEAPRTRRHLSRAGSAWASPRESKRPVRAQWPVPGVSHGGDEAELGGTLALVSMEIGWVTGKGPYG